MVAAKRSRTPDYRSCYNLGLKLGLTCEAAVSLDK